MKERGPRPLTDESATRCKKSTRRTTSPPACLPAPPPIDGSTKIYNRQGAGTYVARDATAFRISGQDRTRDASDGVWSRVRTAGDASKGGDGSGNPKRTADSPEESGSARFDSRLWSSSSEAASLSCFFEAPDVSRNLVAGDVRKGGGDAALPLACLPIVEMARAAAPESIWRAFCGFWSGSPTVARLSTRGIEAIRGETSARPGDLSPCDEGMRRMMASPLVIGVFFGKEGAGGGATVESGGGLATRGGTRRGSGEARPRSALLLA